MSDLSINDRSMNFVAQHFLNFGIQRRKTLDQNQKQKPEQVDVAESLADSIIDADLDLIQVKPEIERNLLDPGSQNESEYDSESDDDFNRMESNRRSKAEPSQMSKMYLDFDTKKARI